jgi:peptide/nickel transport system substrate-binding protein
MVESYWDRRGGVRSGRRRLLAAGGFAAVGAAAFAAACSSSDSGDATPPAAGDASAAPSPKAGGTFRQMGDTITAGFDVNIISGPVGYVWSWAANKLLRHSVTAPYSLEPDLAAALPEIPADGTLVTFKLNPAARFHNRPPVDGRALTADDVKATFERIKDPALLAPRAGNLVNIDSITAVDPQTVQFKLKAPQADILYILAETYNYSVIPKEIALRGKDAFKTEADVIGTGPYELVSYVPQRNVDLKKRADGYWRPNAGWVDAFHASEQPDQQQQANALRAGQVDAVTLNFDLIDTLKGDKNFATVTSPGTRRETIYLNHTRPPYSDPRVRQAIWRAVNRQQVYDTVFAGNGEPGGPVATGILQWALPAAELAKLPGYGNRDGELRAAKQLLAAAGYPDGFEDTNMSFTTAGANLVAEVVVSNLAEVGIKLKTDIVNVNDSTNRLAKQDYTISISLAAAGGYPDAQLTLYHHTGPKGSRNYSKCGSPELDAKLDKQSTIYDYNQRLALVKEIQAEIINNPGHIWIGSRLESRTFSTRVHGAALTPFSNTGRDAEDVWLE